mgnify:FL=1|jgi:hypothetical protein
MTDSRELSEVVTSHLRLDLNSGEGLSVLLVSDGFQVGGQVASDSPLFPFPNSVQLHPPHRPIPFKRPSDGKNSNDTHVDTDDGTDHLGDDDHVSQVGLDHGGLLVGSSLLLGLSELLNETHWSSLKTSLEPPSGTSVDELFERKENVERVTSLDERIDRVVRKGKFSILLLRLLVIPYAPQSSSHC